MIILAQEYDVDLEQAFIETIDILKRSLERTHQQVIRDQHDRYLGFLHSCISVRNLFESQLAINNHLMEKDKSDANRRLLNSAIQSEIENTKDWIQLLKTSKVNFFRITEKQETPFQYKTPVEDFEIKLSAMNAHINDDPGPFLNELSEEWSERNLLFYE